jgi:hypothetical protein
MSLATTTDKPSLKPQPKRDGPDWWPTPLRECVAARAVLRMDPALAGHRLWEVAAGNGVLLDAMAAGGRDVIGTDLEPRRADIAQHDFLRGPIPIGAIGRFALTNPPFNRMDEFMWRGWKLMQAGEIPGFMLLLRMDVLFTSTRVPLLSAATSIWCQPWRTRWVEGSTGHPRWSFAWVAWAAGHPGPPRMQWLVKSKPKETV